MVQANSFQHISIGAVKTLARLAAKRAVQAELREAGVRVSVVKPGEINAQANAYLANHPELYDQARPRVERMILDGVFGKRAQRAYLMTNAQSEIQPKSITSALQISGAK